jgi:hypothetical protein
MCSQLPHRFHNLGGSQSALRLEPRSTSAMVIKGVRNMGTGQDAADRRSGGRKVFAANIQVRAQSSTSCTFCGFIMTIYPTLSGMTDKDSTTFREHLEKSHGLTSEIQP